MVVNHNLKGKKEAYFSNLAALEAIITENKGKLKEELPLSQGLSMEDLEAYFIKLNHLDETQLSPEELNHAKQKISEGKRLKYQYHHLLQTKPYSFVAKLMGHSPI
ncbi:MAG: hypothetical protein WDZ72_12365 [Cyclobacteriaceae bacterium]